MAILLRCVAMHYPSIKQSKYSNCTVKNMELCAHYHHQVCLIHYFNHDQMPLLMHVIQCRIQVKFRYFIKLLDQDKM